MKKANATNGSATASSTATTSLVEMRRNKLHEAPAARIPWAAVSTVRDPERILIVRLSHLGDVVHALGVFHALHEAFPAARIGWAIQPEFAGLLLGLDGLDRIVTFDRNGGLGAWRSLRRELAHFAPELVVDAQGNTKSAAVALLSGAPRRAAPARADWREPWAAFSANDRAPLVKRAPAHAMQRMEALVRHVVPLARLPLRTDPALTFEE